MRFGIHSREGAATKELEQGRATTARTSRAVKVFQNASAEGILPSLDLRAPPSVACQVHQRVRHGAQQRLVSVGHRQIVYQLRERSCQWNPCIKS